MTPKKKPVGHYLVGGPKRVRRKSGVELYRDASGEWRWRLRAKNGKILADSGEGYKRRPACFAGWRAVVRAARA